MMGMFKLYSERATVQVKVSKVFFFRVLTRCAVQSVGRTVALGMGYYTCAVSTCTWKAFAVQAILTIVFSPS